MPKPLLTLACTPSNDLLRILPREWIDWAYTPSASDAIERAAPGTGVLILGG